MTDKFSQISSGGGIKIFLLLLIFVMIFGGCAAIIKEKPPDEIVTPTLPWDVKNYAVFLKQNMKNMNERYSTEYAPYDFVVDTDRGSTIIQNLIEPEITLEIKDRPWSDSMEDDYKLYKIFKYVQNDYAFFMEPDKWPTVKETVKNKKGDCKSLSLLLMSLLISAGIDTHAAISNGHMWVNAFYDNRWHVLEIDNDPERNKIYSIPGFYDNPLYRIYPDHTEKRKVLVP
ncbi:MAG: hypothetical protein JRF60_02640 [Deltaproteobacteria bacterium]|nr:hypothetical protein [Deltaproteobacteria bacterium]MBW2562808.1 hypothetical protein [Deltaproteobacteria bacterium]